MRHLYALSQEPSFDMYAGKKRVWVEIDLPDHGPLVYAACPDYAGGAWAVGEGLGSGLLLHFDGYSISSVESRFKIPLLDVCCIGAECAWAVV